MAGDVTTTRGFLLNSCRDWDVRDAYGGDRYRRSSGMGLNRPVDDDGRKNLRKEMLLGKTSKSSS